MCEVRAALSPQALRTFCEEIESYMGRVPANVPQGPRSLDIDLLLYGDTMLNTSRLTVPHPRMHERGFVLVPLAEIAPETRHPVLGKTARELLAALGPVQGVARFDAEEAYWKGLKRGKRPVPPIVPPQ